MKSRDAILQNSNGRNARKSAEKIVSQIQRADYEGDRAALKKLYLELMRLGPDARSSARVEYWRGFAMWRRAINGFNENVDPKELEADLQSAVNHFNESSAKDPAFADANPIDSVGPMLKTPEQPLRKNNPGETPK